MLPFRMEYLPSKFLTTRPTLRFQPPYISLTLRLVQFQRMLRWKAPATRREIDTFWFTSKLAAETIPPFTKCGKEFTKAVRGPILQMLSGRMQLGITGPRKATEHPMPRA